MADNGDDMEVFRQLKDEFHKPTTFKEKTDVNELEFNLKKAMKDVGFNLQHVRTNGSKLARKQFDNIVRSLDRTNEEFCHSLLQNNEIDKAKVLKAYGDSYANILRDNGLNRQIQEPDMFDDARLSNKSDSSAELNEEIRKKGIANKHQIEFMGVKPRVDTNRPRSLA